ncbi:MAG: PKD domain-containing protein, partial [Longimicrobiales bacterium]
MTRFFSRRSRLLCVLLPLSCCSLLCTAPATGQIPALSVVEIRVSPTTPEEGEAVSLEAVVDGGGRDLTYTWDPGDGSEAVTGADLASLSHRFRDDGTFTVTVVASEGEAEAEGSVRVTVENAAPVIEALAASPEARRDEPVDFQAVARDPGAEDVLVYRWDFGDGGSAEGPDLHSPSHSFAEPGLHTVTLMVEDGDGGSASETMLVPVERTFEFTFSGIVRGQMTGGYENQPGVTVLTPEQARGALPPNTCQLVIQGDADQGEHFILASTLPAPVEPATVPIADENNVPGTARIQVILMCDRPGVDCSGNLPRYQASSGSVTLTRTTPDRVEGRLDVNAQGSGGAAGLSGPFVATTATIFGFPVSRGEGVCFPAERLAVEDVTPAPDEVNVDVEEAEVRVSLAAALDPSSLDHESFRLEVRLPDDQTGLVPSEEYVQVEGVLEPTGPSSFRFVPREPLLDGVI